jgi:hypothetical protein
MSPMDEDYCCSCGCRNPRGGLRPVPLWLRIAAFPMIAIILIKRRGGSELSDEFCENCRPKQIFCYFVVGIWSMAIVGFLIWELLQGKNPFAR